MASVVVSEVLAALGISSPSSGVCGSDWLSSPSDGQLISRSPATTEPLGTILQASRTDYDTVVEAARSRFRVLAPDSRTQTGGTRSPACDRAANAQEQLGQTHQPRNGKDS